ncbi:unnamed protein product [Cochlearia groenlandica]
MKTYYRSLYLFVMMLITISMMKGCVGCVESERVGLLQLKSYLNSLIPNSQEANILKSWTLGDDIKSDCCLWESVNCSHEAIGGHVVRLELRSVMPYSDKDPPRSLNLSLLHSLPQLEDFGFSWNWFTHLFDPIYGYTSLGRLEKLRTLDLSGNHFNNSVLHFVSATRLLKTLDIDNNKNMEGVFPPKVLKNMSKLEELDLTGNTFSDLDNLGKHAMNNSDSLTIYLICSSNFLVEPLHIPLQSITNLSSLVSAMFPSSLQVLNLKDNQLSSAQGYSEICRLNTLREIDLRFNVLTKLPYCMGNLSRLRTLDLSNNQLNGHLSSFVSSLPSAIEYLSLLHNNFNGSFLFNSLVNQTRLTVLRVSSKVGMVEVVAESSWVPMFQLKILKLQNFILGNSAPRFLVHQNKLCFVDFSYSHLSGGFLGWLLQNNTRLHTLFLNNNLLAKLQLPRIVHGLRILDISRNRISSSIQEDIGNIFPTLISMNLASNRFHGSIPSSMGEMKLLEMLDLSSNSLSGKLPITFLSGCYSLKVLKLSNNQFHGEILSEDANLTSLTWLVLGGNTFTGNLREGLLKSKKISLMDLSDNNFTGKLPLWISTLSSLRYLYLRGNQLNGHFPRTQLHGLQHLMVIDISHNRFSGYIPWNVEFPSLKELRLQSNHFSGSIPDTLFNFEELELLDMRNNNFSVMSLNTIGKGSKLLALLLRNNNLERHIPTKICQLSKVDLLDLSHNKFEGVIPTCLNKMFLGEKSYSVFKPQYLEKKDTTFAQKCYCGYNSSITDLDDDLRNDFQSYPAAIVEFSMKSRYETYQGDIISNMIGLDLSTNLLSGEIPVEIGDLENIRSLDLSNNFLTGSIPDSISKLKYLESLDLSNNKLNGNIPPQLAGLDSLGLFNVSYNNLSGEIPSKGHLTTFDEKSYLGNDHLCGLQINKICNPMGLPKSIEEEEDNEDDLIDMVWFYWICFAFYIFTLIVLSSLLCIDSRLSRKWFYHINILVYYLQRFKDYFVYK